MKLRCPHCRATFENASRSRCPACGKTVLPPGYFDGAKAPDRKEGDRRVWVPPVERAGSRRPGVWGNRTVVMLAAMLVVFLGAMLLIRRPPAAPAADAGFERVARRNLTMLAVALDEFQRHCGRYPTTSEGLPSLVHNPRVAGWQGPYVLELRPDPWGRAFHFSNNGTRFRLYSSGMDGLDGTEDDVFPEDYRALPRADDVFPASIAAPPVMSNTPPSPSTP